MMSVAVAAKPRAERPKAPVPTGIGAGSYAGIHEADPLERVRLIEARVRAVDAKRILADLGLGQGEGLTALNLSQATVNKKAKQDQRLSLDESERVLGVARLVGQVETMVAESGDATGFDAAKWLSRWLRDPVPALGDRRPVDLMGTMEGQALVAATLARMQSGAYA